MDGWITKKSGCDEWMDGLFVHMRCVQDEIDVVMIVYCMIG